MLLTVESDYYLRIYKGMSMKLLKIIRRPQNPFFKMIYNPVRKEIACLNQNELFVFNIPSSFYYLPDITFKANLSCIEFII